MTKLEFATRIILLALSWGLAVARAVTIGLDAGTLWSGGGLLAVTLSLALFRWMDAPPTDREDPIPESLPWSEKLFASLPGRILGILAVATMAIGMGSIVGTLVSVPVLGITETIATLPDILGMTSLGATLSTVGFVVLTVVSAFLGPILSSVFEEWIAYISPVIGGVAGAAIKSGSTIGGTIGEVLESGPIASGILVIGLSAVVGGIATLFHTVLRGAEKLSVKGLTDDGLAGLGLGAINGLILALILGVLGMLR